MKTAILFPAFVNEYSGAEEKVLAAFPNHFRDMLAEASEIPGIDLSDFSFSENIFLDDELKTQYISYIYSCALAGILRGRKVVPGMVTGYSMGLYSALYYCGSISYLDGLALVKGAWEALSAALPAGSWGMGMVVGLTENDVTGLLSGTKHLFICNQNNPHTFILSGEAAELSGFLEAARLEGALRTSLLPVSRPYHTDILTGAVPAVKDILDGMNFQDPRYPYLSSLTMRKITDAAGLKQEVLQNLHHRMDWLGAMQRLIGEGMDVFFECGAGDGLTRNFRFIGSGPGVCSVASMQQFLDRVR